LRINKLTRKEAYLVTQDRRNNIVDICNGAFAKNIKKNDIIYIKDMRRNNNAPARSLIKL
jgi:aspartate 1-decarboxylase